MKKDLYSGNLMLFRSAVEAGDIVWFFGAGISASLTGKVYSWMQWIRDGISLISDTGIASNLNKALSLDDSAGNMVR